MNKFIINPLSREELALFLDDKSRDIIKYFIIKSLFSQPESKVGQKNLPIQIPKEHIEQWFTQALNVKPVGAGSYPVDIYNENEHWGADVKMLNIKVDSSGNVKNVGSGEASLGQKFTGTGLSLDDLFLTKKYEDIKNGWINLYVEKYKALKIKYPSIKKIFYFFILRPGIQEIGTDFYFTGAVLNLNKIKNISVDLQRTTKSSVYLKNFISAEFGNTKIYKAKKRLELRLSPKKWVDSGCAIRISTSFNSDRVDLRDKTINASYLKKEMEKMTKIKINFEI
jgi:hypothetical protein